MRVLFILFILTVNSSFGQDSISLSYNNQQDRDLAKEYQKAFSKDFLEGPYRIVSQKLITKNNFETIYNYGTPEALVEVLVSYQFREKDFCIVIVSATIEDQKSKKKIILNSNIENARGFYSTVKDISRSTGKIYHRRMAFGYF